MRTNALSYGDQGDPFICSYRPLIRQEDQKEMMIYYHHRKVYCVLSEAGKLYKLPVFPEFPADIQEDIDRLRRFFAHMYFTVVKMTGGAYSYVKASPCLKGGMRMVDPQDILPMHPGYALGNIIKKADLMLPILHKKKSDSLREITRATAQIEQIQNEYKLDESKPKWEQDKIYDTAQQNMYKQMVIKNRAEDQVKKIEKEIDELSSNVTFGAIEEMLPIDTSGYQIQYRSFSSERMAYYKCTTQNVRERVESLVADLLLEDVPPSFVPLETIDEVARRIGERLNTENEITLVGSFITCPHVRVLDPVKIRKGAEPSAELRKRADDYYVLTEAVLGAVFIAFGTYTSGSHQPDVKMSSDIQKMMSKLSQFSYISQGAIPKVNRLSDRVDLWEVYCSWKEALETQQYSGYPIGFKFRNLKDILKENNRLLA